MRISVIIPAFNEEASLPSAIQSVTSQLGPPPEILVVDGGSSDKTKEIAIARARLFETESLISKQKNLGANSARGDLLLFLHADCILEQGAIKELNEAIEDPEIAGGAFHLKVCGSNPWLDRYLSWSGSWNARHSGIFLGDHGIFCRRSIFMQIGGFPEIPLMYEFEFMTKLRKYGKVVQLKSRCYASARKFQQNGYLKTMLLMRLLRTFYILGFPTQRLQQKYIDVGAVRERPLLPR